MLTVPADWGSVPEFTNNLPNTEQAVKTKPKQVFFFHFPSFLTVICSLSVIVWLDKGDFPKNVHTVSEFK